MRNLTYKYCFVPGCKSTTINTPDKRFFYVPKNEEREKWLLVCKRAGGMKSRFYCCEDHFDLENDVSNGVAHRLTGCSLRLKKGALPSRFECQSDGEKSYTRNGRKLNVKNKKCRCLTDRVGLPKDPKSSDSPSHILPTINPNLLAISEEPKMVVVDPESDMVVEIDPRAFVSPEMSKPYSEPGPSSEVEPDSSMAEDIPLAMTCEQFPAIESVTSFSAEVKIKKEPEDPSDILSANVERELGKFSQGSPSISSEDSLFQPPVLIKEEIVSEDEL